jgi:hypothetical protein
MGSLENTHPWFMGKKSRVNFRKNSLKNLRGIKTNFLTTNLFVCHSVFFNGPRKIRAKQLNYILIMITKKPILHNQEKF